MPLFERQIAAGGPVTLTDAAMTRFVMTLQQAAGLVMSSVHLARGGEVFVTKMPVTRIADLAAVMIQALAAEHGHDPGKIATQIIGVKAGEKMYEELLNEEEIRRTIEMQDFFVVLPAFKNLYEQIEYAYPGVLRSHVSAPYNSSRVAPLERDALEAYLRANHLLGKR